MFARSCPANRQTGRSELLARAEVVFAKFETSPAGLTTNEALRFVQESRADAAASALKAIVHVSAHVTRDGQPREIPVREVVRGDVITLAAGDTMPADIRLISAKDVFVRQSSLTGKSAPAEKSEVPAASDVAPLEAVLRCTSGRWSGASRPTDHPELSEGDRRLHLVDHPAHRRHGAAGISDQRVHEA